MNRVSRRALLVMPVFVAFAGAAVRAEDEGASRLTGPKTLIAYFTRSGNTRVIAGTLQRVLNANLFEIRPTRPYPEDYEANVAQATRERDSCFAPPLAVKVDGIAGYDEIFLGFPIWGETAPPPIRSFLAAHDLTGKIMRPFITHGGYGLGDSASVLARHAPGARIMEPFVMEADQERQTLNQVRDWIGRIQG